MSRSRHPRPRAASEALRRFQAILPALLSQVAVHGVAHVKIVRTYPAGPDCPASLIVIDDTANRLPGRGHLIDERRIDHAMLQEVRGG